MLGLGIGLSPSLGFGGASSASPAVTAPGSITWTNDGSVGQTYTLTPATWSSGTATRQWYRETLDSTKVQTLIAGATNLTYVAQVADTGFRLVCIETNGAATATSRAIGVVLAIPTLLDSLDSFATYVLSGAATLTNDTTNKVQGASAIKIDRTPTFGQITKASLGLFNPTALGTLAYWYRTGDGDPELSQVGSLGTVALGQGGSYAGTIVDQSSEGAANQNDYRALAGAWMAMHYTESATIAAYNPASQLGVKVSPFQTNSPGNSLTQVDALIANGGGRPTLILDFDDLIASQLILGKPILDTYGIKVNFNVATAYIGQAGKMTDAQIQQLYAEGHALMANGTSTDTPMTSLADPAAVIADFNANTKPWFVARGIPVPEHACYPNGLAFLRGTRVQLTGVTFVSGTNTCVVSSAAGITAGMKITSYGVATSPIVTVVSIAGTTITMSANATQSGSLNATFVDASGPFHTGKLPDALGAIFKSCRMTVGTDFHSRFGPSGRAMVHTGTATAGQTLAQLNAILDKIQLRGTTGCCYTHGLDTGGTGGNTDTTIYSQFIASAAARRDAGNLDILVKPQWWARDGGSGVPV